MHKVAKLILKILNNLIIICFIIFQFILIPFDNRLTGETQSLFEIIYILIISSCVKDAKIYSAYTCVYILSSDSVSALEAGRSMVRFPIVSFEFFIDIILQAALWPWGQISL